MHPCNMDTRQNNEGKQVKLIGVCIDESPNCASSFYWYLDNAYVEGHKIALIHVHVPPPLPAVPVYPAAGAVIVSEEWQQSLQVTIDKSRRLIQKFKQVLLERGIPFIVCAESDQDSPGNAINRIVAQNGMSMVVVGSRGLNAIRRTFLGSVSSYLVHHSHCAVMVIPPVKIQ